MLALTNQGAVFTVDIDGLEDAPGEAVTSVFTTSSREFRASVRLTYRAGDQNAKRRDGTLSASTVIAYLSGRPKKFEN